MRNEFPDWHTILNGSRLDFFRQSENNQTVGHSDSQVYSVATDIDQHEMSYRDHSTSSHNQTRNQRSSQSDFSASDTSQTRAPPAQRVIPDNRSPVATGPSPTSVHVPPSGQNSVQANTANTANTIFSNRDFPPLSGQDPNNGGDTRLLPNGPRTIMPTPTHSQNQSK